MFENWRKESGGAEKGRGMEGKDKTSDLRGQESDTAGPLYARQE